MMGPLGALAVKRILPLLYVLIVPLPALSASVKSVNAKKKTVEVTPDDGETMEKDQTVCIFDEKEKKRGCGNVTSVKGDGTVVVKIGSAKKLKKIKEGMSATVSVDSLNEGADAAAEVDSGAGSDDSVKSKKKGKKAKAKGRKAKRSAKKKGPPLRFWLDYGKFIAAPATYKKLSYDAPTNETPTTLWASEKESSDTAGFNFQVGIPLAGFSLNPGVRYRVYTPSVVDADYVRQRGNPYVSTEQKGSAYGVFVDFAFLHIPFIPQIAFNTSAGLDIDLSTVTIDAKKKTDDPTNFPIEGSDTITSLTSKLTVISLRLGTGLDFVFGVFGGHFGLNVLLPVSESGSVSGSFGDGEDRGVQDQKEDLKSALAHKKNGYAAELLLGVMLAF